MLKKERPCVNTNLLVKVIIMDVLTRKQLSLKLQNESIDY